MRLKLALLVLVSACLAFAPNAFSAPPLSADFEGASNGAYFQGAFTGSSPATDITMWTSGDITYSNTHVHGGSLAAKIRTGNNTTQLGDTAFLGWGPNTHGTLTTEYGRTYLYFTALPAHGFWFMLMLNANNPIGGIWISPTGQFVGSNNTLTNCGAPCTMNTPIALNQWVRFEWKVVHNTSTGSIEMKLFNSADSVTPTETKTAVNINTGNSANSVTLGVAKDNGNTLGPFWLDDVAFSTTGYPGPSGGGGGATPTRLASMEDSTFGEFDSINSNATQGTLAVSSTRAYVGTKSALATTPASSTGVNKFARGIWQVPWDSGTDVYYGAAFYLPSGFYSSMQGEVAILRWDNFDPAGCNCSQEQSGVVIQNSTHYLGIRTRSFVGTPPSGWGGADAPIVNTTTALSEGAWHWVEVRQKFSNTAGAAVNELWVDGVSLGSSTASNMLSTRRPLQLRVGIVATNDPVQSNQLQLWFDRATISDGLVGP